MTEKEQNETVETAMEETLDEEVEKQTSSDSDMTVEELEEFEVGQGIDVSEFEGHRVEIEGVKIVDTSTPYDEDGNYVEGLRRPKKALKVFSKPVTTVEDAEGNVIQIRASELFNLKLVDGKWGVSTSENAKINKFLAKMKVPLGLEGVKHLAGKHIIMKTTGKNNNYLGFVY